MNMKLLFAGSARMMVRYKMRTLFMAVGIVVGVSALVFMRAMGVGAEQAMMDNINRTFSTATINVMAGGGHMGPRSGGPVTTLKMEDFQAIEAAVPGVALWGVMQWAPKQDIRYQGITRQMSIFGYSDKPEAVWQRGVIQGEYFSAEDVNSASRVAVIGTRAAEALFGTDDPIGKQIQVGSVPLRITGVLEPQGIDTHGSDKDDEIHVPVTTLMRRIMNADHLFGGRVVLDSPAKVETAAKQINTLLRERHSIAENEPPDFVAITPKLVQDIVGNANRVLSRYLPAAAGVALLVAAIVIANIMLIAIKERIPEIGIRKAVGAENGQINFQFLSETIVVALTSGLIGAGLGIIAAFGYGALGTTPMAVTPGSVLLGLGAAILVGIVSGVMPARQASMLDPVSALR
ncbi:MAG: FtsX-like permease family protein [Rhodospirillaceae bacterium]|nr:FtsX-like permease family protein [Rhodospirillaceae bacterium]